MPIPSHKHLIPTLSVILIIVLAIGAIFYFKPKLAVDQVSTESSKLENIPTNLGLNFEGQKITFNYLHELIINNQSKGISKEFNINLNDLKEGQNNLEFKGVKTYGPIITESKSPKVFQITTDKTAPELNLVSEVPKFVQLEKEIKLKLKTEIGTKIILNDKELNKAENEETEITIPVVDGKNTNQITTKDSFGNTSKPLDIEFQALQREGWEKFKCGNFTFPINRNALQIGYAGVVNPSKTSSKAQENAILSSTQNPNCIELPKVSFTINPKGTKLYCTACDVNSYLIYFDLDNPKYMDVYLGGADYTDVWGKYLVKKEIYISKADVKWEIREFNLPTEGVSVSRPPRTNYMYVTSVGGVNYRLSTDVFPSSKAPTGLDYLKEIVDNTVVSN